MHQFVQTSNIPLKALYETHFHAFLSGTEIKQYCTVVHRSIQVQNYLSLELQKKYEDKHI